MPATKAQHLPAHLAQGARPAMDIHETDLEMARRHVAEAQRRLHRQQALLVTLAELGRDTELAAQTLATFEAALQAMREHLAVEERLERPFSLKSPHTMRR